MSTFNKLLTVLCVIVVLIIFTIVLTKNEKVPKIVVPPASNSRQCKDGEKKLIAEEIYRCTDGQWIYSGRVSDLKE